LNNTFRWIYWH